MTRTDQEPAGSSLAEPLEDEAEQAPDACKALCDLLQSQTSQPAADRPQLSPDLVHSSLMASAPSGAGRCDLVCEADDDQQCCDSIAAPPGWQDSTGPLPSQCPSIINNQPAHVQLTGGSAHDCSGAADGASLHVSRPPGGAVPDATCDLCFDKPKDSSCSVPDDDDGDAELLDCGSLPDGEILQDNRDGIMRGLDKGCACQVARTRMARAAASSSSWMMFLTFLTRAAEIRTWAWR